MTLPPSSRIPTSKLTRVRVEGLLKSKAQVCPSSAGSDAFARFAIQSKENASYWRPTNLRGSTVLKICARGRLWRRFLRAIEDVFHPESWPEWIPPLRFHFEKRSAEATTAEPMGRPARSTARFASKSPRQRAKASSHRLRAAQTLGPARFRASAPSRVRL